MHRFQLRDRDLAVAMVELAEADLAVGLREDRPAVGQEARQTHANYRAYRKTVWTILRRSRQWSHEPADCFAVRRPVVVPARSFLSQLL